MGCWLNMLDLRELLYMQSSVTRIAGLSLESEQFSRKVGLSLKYIALSCSFCLYFVYIEFIVQFLGNFYPGHIRWTHDLVVCAWLMILWTWRVTFGIIHISALPSNISSCNQYKLNYVLEQWHYDTYLYFYIPN